jgi:hypothetical protein
MTVSSPNGPHCTQEDVGAHFGSQIQAPRFENFSVLLLDCVGNLLSLVTQDDWFENKSVTDWWWWDAGKERCDWVGLGKTGLFMMIQFIKLSLAKGVASTDAMSLLKSHGLKYLNALFFVLPFWMGLGFWVLVLTINPFIF